MPRATKKEAGQRWSIRKNSPTPNELADLKLVIQVIASRSGADRVAQNDAFSKLEKAIDDFRMHYPYVKDSQKIRGTVADQRESLNRLSKSLRASLSAAESLPYNAKIVFGGRINTPLGKVAKLLNQWAMASSEEYTKAQKAGDRPADDAPAVLAYDVAKILQRVLHTRITLTSDRNTSGSSRGGAAYCRLLRATMQAAGHDPPSDLVPVMKDGKKLLDHIFLDDE